MQCDKKLNLAELKELIKTISEEYEAMQVVDSPQRAWRVFYHFVINEINELINASEKENKIISAMCPECGMIIPSESNAELNDLICKHICKHDQTYQPKKEEPMKHPCKHIEENADSIRFYLNCEECANYMTKNPFKMWLPKPDRELQEELKMKHPCGSLFEYAELMKKMAGESPVRICCPACATPQTVQLINYFTCIACQEEITVNKEQLSDLKKLDEKEENKMKHPCGKVFDVGKEFKCNDEGEIEWVEITPRVIVVKYKICGNYIIYLPCGHKNEFHIDLIDDLVNVPEVREIDLDEIQVFGQKHGDEFNIFINGCFFIRIKKEGLVSRIGTPNTSVLKKLGFQLDEQGRIKLDE